ncbi:MAG: 6-bladed beta-propeller [Candidatus Krumholzibacteriia bacterium]
MARGPLSSARAVGFALLALLALSAAVPIATVSLAAAAPAATAAPAADVPVTTIRLAEEWRAGGADDDIFFGSVARVATDTAGRLHVLDSQLSEVHVYSPDGEHLTVLGREGDGPGEARRPSDFFHEPDGTVCLLQGFPGKLVRITADGRPGGSAEYQAAGAATPGQFAVLVSGRAHPVGMTLAGIRMSFGGGSESRQVYFLDICDRDGKRQHSVLEKEHVINYADLRFDEAEMDFVWGRYAVGPDGRIYHAPERNAYRIVVASPTGEQERAIEQPYQPLPRTADQTERARRIIEAVGANYPAPMKGLRTEPAEPAITGLHVRPDGSLWVLTSRGSRERGAGIYTVVDEIGPDGRLVRRVALAAPGDPDRDQLFFLADGRAVIVTGALDAWLNQQGVAAGEAAAADEAAPLELICYRME